MTSEAEIWLRKAAQTLSQKLRIRIAQNLPRLPTSICITSALLYQPFAEVALFDLIPQGRFFSLLRPVENLNMRTAWLLRCRILVLGLFIGSNVLLVGCGSDSGTQVAENPQAAAHRKAKGEAYKGGPPKKESKSAGKGK